MSRLVLDQENRRGEVAAALGMSFARTRALRRIAAAEHDAAPLTMRELAVRLGTDPPHVTLMIDDLEAGGFVRRRPHPEDGRAKVVEITDSGRAAAALAEEILGRPPRALTDLPAADLASLTAILERIAPPEPPAP
jgi:DNA-binding MarR family transcriptional regulator